MDESLWPARDVAEYVYCPRLFHYMEVEGIHVPSKDTDKIANQRKLLTRNHAALPPGVADAMAKEGDRAARTASLEALRGHEGQAVAAYFGHFAGMVKCDLTSEFDGQGRQRRPPPDPVNACLSLADSIAISARQTRQVPRRGDRTGQRRPVADRHRPVGRPG